MSVYPDDTKRSLMYGNVLVMSLLITLDSAMAPTAHTHSFQCETGSSILGRECGSKLKDRRKK